MLSLYAPFYIDTYDTIQDVQILSNKSQGNKTTGGCSYELIDIEDSNKKNPNHPQTVSNNKTSPSHQINELAKYSVVMKKPKTNIKNSRNATYDVLAHNPTPQLQPQLVPGDYSLLASAEEAVGVRKSFTLMSSGPEVPLPPPLPPPINESDLPVLAALKGSEGKPTSADGSGNNEETSYSNTSPAKNKIPKNICNPTGNVDSLGEPNGVSLSVTRSHEMVSGEEKEESIYMNT